MYDDTCDPTRRFHRESRYQDSRTVERDSLVARISSFWSHSSTVSRSFPDLPFPAVYGNLSARRDFRFDPVQNFWGGGFGFGLERNVMSISA